MTVWIRDLRPYDLSAAESVVRVRRSAVDPSHHGLGAGSRPLRAAGYTEAFTGSDAGNEPMLAVNKWFGYEIRATESRFAKSLKRLETV
ncbi:hypothetical protein ACGFYU_12300 [Streptomyces sp. NPDC048337]|uniref:hypothetical protein n=1 Tax=Streptomyces sp. NPDC048337 TaxID=3365535 RepID=UPI00371A7BB3